MIYHNLTDYLNAVLEWKNKTFIISCGFVFYNGQPITATEYYNSNPKPRYEVKLLENPDGTQIASGVKTRK